MKSNIFSFFEKLNIAATFLFVVLGIQFVFNYFNIQGAFLGFFIAIIMIWIWQKGDVIRKKNNVTLLKTLLEKQKLFQKEQCILAFAVIVKEFEEAQD